MAEFPKWVPNNWILTTYNREVLAVVVKGHREWYLASVDDDPLAFSGRTFAYPDEAMAAVDEYLKQQEK